MVAAIIAIRTQSRKRYASVTVLKKLFQGTHILFSENNLTLSWKQENIDNSNITHKN